MLQLPMEMTIVRYEKIAANVAISWREKQLFV
jgi:hypothetical protein